MKNPKSLSPKYKKFRGRSKHRFYLLVRQHLALKRIQMEIKTRILLQYPLQNHHLITCGSEIQSVQVERHKILIRFIEIGKEQTQQI